MMTAGAAVLTVVLATAAVGHADEAQLEGRHRWAVGVEIDLLPIVLSAAAGELGAGANAWIGVDRFRFRCVGTHAAFPSSLAPKGFIDRKLDVVAAVVDVFARRDLSGPWLGTGVEYWWNSARAASGGGTARWESPVYTLGGGWVVPVWRGAYVNPWAAGHVLLSRPAATAGAETWRPGRLAGEVSVKVGWLFAF
jgi:hypothetical protein